MYATKPRPKMAKFVDTTWAACFARQKPVSTSAKPACMKMTSTAPMTIQSRLTLISPWVSALPAAPPAAAGRHARGQRGRDGGLRLLPQLVAVAIGELELVHRGAGHRCDPGRVDAGAGGRQRRRQRVQQCGSVERLDPTQRVPGRAVVV